MVGEDGLDGGSLVVSMMAVDGGGGDAAARACVRACVRASARGRRFKRMCGLNGGEDGGVGGFLNHRLSIDQNE